MLRKGKSFLLFFAKWLSLDLGVPGRSMFGGKC